MTPEQFQRWLAHAAAGGGVTYHTGFLARDAGKAPATIGKLAGDAYRANSQGVVLLVQSRGPSKFAYIAVRTTKRFPPPARKPPRHRVQHLEAA